MSRPELLAALLLCAGSASAHGLDQREGRIVVEADRVVTTMMVDAGSEAAALRELVIRDGEGRRLVGHIASAAPAGEPGHVMLRVEYSLDHPARWLSFQLAPDEATPRARRLALSVTAEGTGESTSEDAGGNAGDAWPRRVTLTSGGNVETLRFGGALAHESPGATARDSSGTAAEEACGPALLDRHPERLQSPQALLREDAQGARLDVVLPLGLLETWLPLARADRDGISVAEQAQARDAVLGLVAGRVRMVAEGRDVPPEAGEVVFLGLDDAAVDAMPAPRRLDAWTARVRVSFHFSRVGTLEWDLWNARVTTASVVVISEGPACTQRRVSTYEPRL